jgi:hypothetical protein
LLIAGAEVRLNGESGQLLRQVALNADRNCQPPRRPGIVHHQTRQVSSMS